MIINKKYDKEANSYDTRSSLATTLSIPVIKKAMELLGVSDSEKSKVQKEFLEAANKHFNNEDLVIIGEFYSKYENRLWKMFLEFEEILSKGLE